MSNAGTVNRNASWFMGAAVYTPQVVCPIPLGTVGTWNNNGVLYNRLASGVDKVVSDASALPVFGALTKTAAALPACTYANGTAGVGATLTANANAAIGTVGGVAITVVGTVIEVTEQVSSFQNGLYAVTQIGTGSLPWILTRLPGFDTAARMVDGTIVSVQQGTYAGLLYVMDATVTTVGTDAITFALSSSGVTESAVRTAAAAFTATFAVNAQTLSNAGGVVFTKETAISVAPAASTTAATAGGAVTAAGGSGSTSGAGGAWIGKGGLGGVTGAGGAASTVGGAGGATSGLGGAANLTGGAGTAGNSAGGMATVAGGAGQGSAAGGGLAANGGVGGATGAGGAVSVAGGAGGATSGTGGAVTVAGGAGSAGNANGGALTIRGGAKNGAGTDGALLIGATNTASVGIGATGVTTTLNGTLALATAAASSLLAALGIRVGQATLVGGTVTVTDTAVTTTTTVYVTLATANTTAATTAYQHVYASNSVGASFVLRSNVAAGTINVLDVSTLNYFAIG